MIFKRVNFLFAGLLFCFCARAQVNLVIDIKVLNEDGKSPIVDCPIYIKPDSGEIIKLKTDDEGILHYVKYNAHFKKAQVYTQTHKDLKTLQAPAGFLASEDRLEIDLTGKTINETVGFNKTFYLRPVLACWDWQSIHFKKNSTTYDTVYNFEFYSGGVDSSYFFPSNIYNQVVERLKFDRRIVINVIGHADFDEKNPDSLSDARVQKIMQTLLKTGIDKKRVVGKIFGIRKPVYDKPGIRKGHGKKEKEKRHAVNRRCSFQTFSFDFVPLDVTIIGNVIDKSTQTPIPAVQVIYKDDQGVLKEITTDRDGHFSINFFDVKFKKAEVYLQITKDTRTITSPYGFLGSDDRIQISIPDSAVGQLKFKKDFYLTPNPGCVFGFPNMLFKKNSIEYFTAYPKEIPDYLDSSYYLAKTNLDELEKTLRDNPTIVIELSSHCSSDEKNVEALSHKRAQKVFDELIRRGINQKRMVAKGYGIKKLKITDTQIKKSKTKEEKEALHSINRRCVFKILRWDFEDPNVPKIEKEKYHPKISGEEE